MPGLDRKGPEGKGSQTGRKMGKCNPQKDDSSHSDEQNSFLGRNRNGKGRGLGQGLGNGNGNGIGRGMRRNA